MPAISVGKSALKGDVEIAQIGAPQLEKVKWWTDPGLRKLYFWAAVLCVASATTGYDGYGTSSIGKPNMAPTCSS